MSHGRTRRLVVLALAAFVSLGLPDGLLGVAWPSIRRTFDLPTSQLGSLLAASMIGYLVSSFTSGAIVGRLGIGPLLLGSTLAMVASLAGYATSPAWGLVLVSALLAGLGAAGIDAGINTFAAAHFTPRLVNWLHASYGVGAMLGPLVMTGMLATDLGWRAGYATVGLILGGMAAGFWFTLDLWRAPSAAGGSRTGEVESPPGLFATARRPTVGIGIAVFFVYAGLETAAGQWMYSLLTEARGTAPAVAGVSVGLYWGSLTAGRLVFGALTRYVPAERLLRVAMLAAPIAAALIWSGPTPIVDFAGLVGLGFALAPIYPLLISATPRRVGQEHAANAIGLQVAAAYVGTAAIPGLIGIVANRAGLEVIGPSLLGTALALLLLQKLALHHASRLRSAPLAT
jgi:fucose permease